MGESGVAYPETRKDDFLVTGDFGCGGPRDRLFLICFGVRYAYRRCQDLEISER